MRGEPGVESGEQRAALIVLLIALVLAVPGCGKRLDQAGGVGAQGGKVSYYTCSLCHSVKSVTESGRQRSDKVIYRSPRCAMCPHVWKEGIDPFAEPPIPDGRIVLVKRGRALGALILMNQRLRPAHTDYVWYCRTDGRGTFRRRDIRMYRTSSGSTNRKAWPVKELDFGQFSMIWSPTQDGKGVVGYAGFPGQPKAMADTLMYTLICPTTETDIEKIDATDPKWVYKASVDAPGRSGTAP